MTTSDPHGPLDALARFGGALVDALGNRLELAGLELVRARDALVTSLVAAVIAALAFVGAIAALSAWLAVACWDTLGPAVLGVLALVYAAGGAAVLGWLRLRLRRAPPLLAETLAELRADATALAHRDVVDRGARRAEPHR